MARTEVGEGHGQQRVALVLDHHEDDAESLARLVNQMGWSCNLVTDQSSFEDSLKRHPCAAVLVRDDFGEQGFEELIARLDGLHPDQAVIVIQSAEKRFSEASESYAVLSHPVSEESLREALGAVNTEMVPTPPKPKIEDFSEEFSITSKELSENPLEPETFERIRAAFSSDLTEALQVELAFQEALANAYEHGNLELESEWREEIDASGVDKFSRIKEERLRDSTYANRLIQIFLSITDGNLQVEIQDEGKGFPFKKSKNGGSQEDVKTYGRGRRLMTLVMDDVQYSEGGRKIKLTKTFSK